MIRSLRDFLVGWRQVKIALADRTSAFDAMYRAEIAPHRERRRGEAVFFRIKEADERRLRAVFAERGIGAEISGKRGVPAAFAFCLRRPAVPLGLILLAVWLFWSGRLVWDIRVEGNGDVPAEEIVEVLASLGFEIGTDYTRVDFDQLHADYVAAQNRIAWLSVVMDGTVARVQVREMLPGGSEPPPAGTAANVVASAGGVIEEIDVREGTAAARAGDVVRPGQVLISGVIENKDGTSRFEYASGEVWATVAVPLSVEIPLERGEYRETGREKTRFSIKIFKKTINLSRNYGIAYATYDKIDTIGRVCLFGTLDLPIWIERHAARETEPVTVTLTEEEAAGEARTAMRALIRRETENGTLLVKQFTERCEGGVFRLDALLYLTRDIGETAEFAVAEAGPGNTK